MTVIESISKWFSKIFVSILASFYFVTSLFNIGGKTMPEIILPPEHPINAMDAMPDTYAATDALGRTLSSNEDTGDVREDRFVGLFYWTWHVAQAKWTQKAVNVNQVVTDFPQASHDLNFPGWGAMFQPHHWNEPLFGFYDTDDKWVLRKHAEMLASAGVDVIIFDNTNGIATWKDSYEVLFEVFAQARAQGVKTPKISFILPFGAGDNTNTQLRELYNDIYKDGRYQDLWFYWKGKPLLMAYPDKLDLTDKTDKAIRGFFAFRPANPVYNATPSKGQWGWMSVYPQAVYKNIFGKAEQTTVGVAQNWSAERGLTAMNDENVFGRTYTSKGYDTRENAKLYGANFAEQFDYALEVDPEFIFITGFNEWVAGRHDTWQGVTNAFPDEFDDTNSRDIEPTKGDLADNYYYQMVEYIRRFKGTRKPTTDTKLTTIDINAPESNWNGVGKTYYSYPGNTFDRDDIGYASIHYTDTSGRNDITLSKVTSDNDNIYFMVQCADAITLFSGDKWMRLLLDTGERKSNWNGYEFIVNRVSPSSKKAVIESSIGGWNWEKVGEVEYNLRGDTLQIVLPKVVLGISGNSFSLNFKWSDNTLSSGDILDFYLYGDTAPLGRFMYVYKSEK